MRRTVTSARIDVPLRSAHAYMFVAPEYFAHEVWWASLYDYLRSFAHSDLEWTFEPVQSVYIAEAKLSGSQLGELARFLRTAPAAVIAGHKTLRKATELSGDAERRIRLVLFSKST